MSELQTMMMIIRFTTIMTLLPFYDVECVEDSLKNARAGDVISLPCTKTPTYCSNVVWRYTHQKGSQIRYVFTADNVVDSYKPRFAVNFNGGADDYALTISGVLITDSGLYTCADCGGLEVITTVRLHVRGAAAFELKTLHGEKPTEIVQSTKAPYPASTMDISVPMLFGIIMVTFFTTACFTSVLLFASHRVSVYISQKSTRRNAELAPMISLKRDNSQLIASLSLKSVQSAAQLDNIIYIICKESNTILAYDVRETYAIATPITVNGLKGPCDIVACIETRRLYVADNNPEFNGCVWLISQSGKQDEIHKWLPRSDSALAEIFPHSLSVRCGGRLVVMSAYKELFVFAPDGTQLQHVTLPTGCDYFHAVETGWNTFVVIIWKRGCVECRISMIETDAEGYVEELRTYSGPDKLDHPCYLVVDGSNRVIVADSGNNRVLLLDSQLQFERVLIDSDNLRNPRQLSLAKSSSVQPQEGFHLIVCSNSTGVVVFKIDSRIR